MFGCEPGPIYVFGTGVPMKPASALHGILQRLMGTCHLTPDYGESVSSYFFQQPLDVYSWREQTEEGAKAGIPRQLKRTTFNPEATRSPFARNWSTYYGPGHAMTIALLDLSQPPLQRTSEDQLVEALRRTLSWVLAPNPQMRKQLGLSVDRDRGAWIQRSESSSSTSSRSNSALLPPQIIGDTGVDIDEENLATLCMTINVEGPVTGAELRLNPWARLEGTVPNLMGRGFGRRGIATSLALALGYEGHVLGDDTVLSHRAVQWFTTQMMTGLARELQLGPPRFVGPGEVFPSEELGLTDVIPIPVPLPGGFDFGGFDIF
ncbi:hypothetical protein PG995_013261 [Apiospora arundinis]